MTTLHLRRPRVAARSKDDAIVAAVEALGPSATSRAVSERAGVSRSQAWHAWVRLAKAGRCPLPAGFMSGKGWHWQEPRRGPDERNALVLDNLGAVHAEARAYHRRWGGDLDDITGVAMLLALRAAETFDEARGGKFQSHARLAIRLALARGLRGGHRSGKVAPTTPVDPDSLRWVAARDDRYDPEAGKLLAAMASLPEHQRELIARRFGFDGFGASTLPAVARAMGIGRAEARQVQEDAFCRLRGLVIGRAAS